MVTDLILGTAGHIDHGKTALIRSLTGVDTDRLPEEKRRGITIELGFAQLDVDPYHLGIVDVPGHERFVRNMLSGATGMDLALLVVAADDSVKPQTREHLEILRLLDLPAGVIALTKCDLVEDGWMNLVEEEVRALVRGTFMADSPIVRTSATTGEGIDRLRSQLCDAAHVAAGSTRTRQLDSPFRMAIDRTFTMAGHGTVVTGSVSSGRVKVGDELEIQPGNLPVRVRGMENHELAVQQIHRGQRAAINLAGVHHDQIVRGQELGQAGHLIASKLLTVNLAMLPGAPRPLKNRSRVRIHIGTAELMASVVVLDGQHIEPGQTAPAQLFLNQPAVASWNQPFVLRSESPVVTVGGGHVLDPHAEKIRQPSDTIRNMIGDLASGNQVCRASAALFFAGLRDWHPEQLNLSAGIDDVQSVHAQLLELGDLMEIRVSPRRSVRVHRLVIDELSDRMEATLKRLHQQNPLLSKIDTSKLLQRFEYLGDRQLLAEILESLHRRRRVKMSGSGVALAGFGPKLSQNERKIMAELVENFRRAEFQPPTVKQCQMQATRLRNVIPQLIAVAAADGDLVEVSSEYYLHAEAHGRMCRLLADAMAKGHGLTLSQIREILNTTRKYAVPMAEYLDREGYTRREGDLRVWVHDTQSDSPTETLNL